MNKCREITTRYNLLIIRFTRKNGLQNGVRLNFIFKLLAYQPNIKILIITFAVAIARKKTCTLDMPQFLRFLTFSDLDFWPFQLKTGIPLACAQGNVYTNSDFSTFFFVFGLPAHTGQTDRQTDRQRDRQDTQCGLQDGQIISMSIDFCYFS